MVIGTGKNSFVPVLLFSISLVFLTLYINSEAFAAVSFPWLQIEEKLPVTKPLEKDINGSLTIQTITGAAGGGGSCEQCQFIVYHSKTSAPSKAVIALTSTTPFDLSDAKRIVFFAKGELGGETIKALAIKKSSATVPGGKPKFAEASPNIVLTNEWKRYELSVKGLDLKDITSPFGLEISNQRKSIPILNPPVEKTPLNNHDVKDISFYLKGVSMDDKSAANPLNGSTITTASFNSTEQTLATKIYANSTNSPAPSTIEFGGNATGGLAPYSYEWNFNIDSSTEVGPKVLRTFDTPGNYTVTLGAKDSGSPSQNASAVMIITITSSVNKTKTESLIVGVTNSTNNVDANRTSTVALEKIEKRNSTDSTAATAIDFGANSTDGNSKQDTGLTLKGKNVDEFSTENYKNMTLDPNNGGTDVNSINHSPVARDQGVKTYVNKAVNIFLKGADQDNDPITFQLVSDPLKGVLAGFDNRTGTVTYIPNPILTGSDSFTFKVIDIHNMESNVGRVSETVIPIRSAVPLVGDVNAATSSNKPVTIILKATAQDNVDSLKFALISAPSHGKLSEFSDVDKNSIRVTYTPDKGYFGNDVFKFKADDPDAGTDNVAKVSITVIGSQPALNSAPVSIAQFVETEVNKRVPIVLGATDVDGDKLIFSKVTDPLHGNLITFDSSTGKSTYKPDANFAGGDSFTFKVKDQNELDSNIAKVSIRVTSAGADLSSSSYLHPSASDKAISTESVQRQVSPELINHNPLANAGLDRVVHEGTNYATLNGTGKDLDGDRLSFSWEQIAGPPVDIIGTNTARPILNIPNVVGNKALSFVLTVSDGKGGQNTDDVKITIEDKDLVNNRIIQDRIEGVQTFNHTLQLNR